MCFSKSIHELRELTFEYMELLVSDFLKYEISGVVNNGELVSPKMRTDLERSYISVAFFTDVDFTDQVIPSAGTITFTASEDGFVYGTIPNGTVSASSETYDRPNFSGSVERVKAETSGILGATHYIATIARFEG